MEFTVDKFTFIKREQKWVDGCSFFYVEWKDEEGISFYKYGTTCDCNCYIINKGCHSFEPLICLVNRHFELNLIKCSMYITGVKQLHDLMAIEQKDLQLPNGLEVSNSIPWEEPVLYATVAFPCSTTYLDRTGMDFFAIMESKQSKRQN